MLGGEEGSGGGGVRVRGRVGARGSRRVLGGVSGSVRGRGGEEGRVGVRARGELGGRRFGEAEAPGFELPLGVSAEGPRDFR